MSAYYWKTSKFKKLSDKWAKELKKSGFNDIEEKDSPREMLKRWDGAWIKQLVKGDAATFDDIQEYYLKCSHALNTHKFKKPLDKQIWKLYAEGLPMRQIATEVGYSKSYVFNIISRLRKEIKWSL